MGLRTVQRWLILRPTTFPAARSVVVLPYMRSPATGAGSAGSVTFPAASSRAAPLSYMIYHEEFITIYNVEYENKCCGGAGWWG